MVGHGYWCRWVDIVILWQSIFLFLSLDRAEAPGCPWREETVPISLEMRSTIMTNKASWRRQILGMILILWSSIQFILKCQECLSIGWVEYHYLEHFIDFVNSSHGQFSTYASLAQYLETSKEIDICLASRQRPPAAWTDKHCLVSVSGEDVKKLGLELQTIHRFSQSQRKRLLALSHWRHY